MSRRLLFVCLGNMCRSPMAAALAKAVHPDVSAESAGWAPQDSIASNAAEVIHEMIGVDISGYIPRDVTEFDLAAFDMIVILGPRLRDEIQVPESATVVVWDIRDPYGESKDRYRRCAADLRARIENELADV